MLSEYLIYPDYTAEFLPFQIGSSIAKNSDSIEDPENFKIALVGMADLDGSYTSANLVRNSFYALSSSGFIEDNLIDLGNIREGATAKDTGAALYFVAEFCILHGVIPLVLTDSEELAEELFASLHIKQDPIEVSYVGSRIPLLSHQVLDRLIDNHKTQLLSLNCIGFQGHIAPPMAIETLINLSFGQLRLGAYTQNQEEGELLVRNSGLTIFHLDSVKLADAPASKASQPVGLTAEQFCQLSYYAGVSDNLFAALFAGCQLSLESNNQTAQLVALGLWYLVDGISNRKEDHPLKHDEFLLYKCAVGDKQPEIVFYKSKRTNRWWMDIEAEQPQNSFIPCTYSDYQKAVNGELPDRYLNALQKLV